MSDLKALLERADRAVSDVPLPADGLEGLQRRRDRKRRNQRITAGVVGIAVFVAAIWIVTTAGSFHNAQTPAVPGTSPSPPPPGVDLQELERTVGGVTFSFNVPITHHRVFESSWEPKAGISINKSIVGPQGAEAMFFWTSFPDDKRADPCARLFPSATDLAAAVATAPGTELVEGPSDVTVGGYPAKHVVLTVRQGLGCDPGFFYTWHYPAGGALFTETTVGDTIRVWIVRVDGTRLFLEAVTTEQADFDLEQEIEQIVGSIRFVDTPTPGASGSTGPSDTRVSAPKVDYVIDLNTGVMTPLPDTVIRSLGGPLFEHQYAVSPDGSRLAYVGTSDQDQIFIAGIDGTGVRQVTHAPNGAWSPAWSPDGTRIAYEALDSGHQLGLYVLDVASGESTQITGVNADYERGGDSTLRPGQPLEPQFTPDGSSLVYTGGSNGHPVIWIVPVTGGESTLLIGPSGNLRDAENGSLSPDGSLVTFLGSQIGGPGPRRWVADTDGSERRLLPEAYGIPCRSAPSGTWSGDGSRIVCAEASKVIVLDIATGAATPVAYGRGAIWLDDHTLLVSV